MRASVLYKPGDVRVEERADPKLPTPADTLPLEQVAEGYRAGRKARHPGASAAMRTWEGSIRTRPAIKLVAALLALAGCTLAAPSRAADAESPPPPSADAGSSDAGSSSPEVATMKIRLITEGAVLTATLDDNAATRDFVSLLPLSLTLRDYAGTEKVSDLPRRLSTAGTPPGADPEAGDLGYYAPWGNLAIYYRDFEYSSGLVKLGHIESGIEKLAGVRGNLVVRFELAEETP